MRVGGTCRGRGSKVSASAPSPVSSNTTLGTGRKRGREGSPFRVCNNDDSFALERAQLKTK